MSTGSAQKICNKLDNVLLKVLDLLTPVLTKTVRCNKYKPIFVTTDKKKLKNLHKKAKKKKCPVLKKEVPTSQKKKKKKDGVEIQKWKNFQKDQRSSWNSQSPGAGSLQWKKKKIHLHEENWLTKDLVEKSFSELKPKRCSGFERVPLVFLRDGASELSQVVTKILLKSLKKEQLQNNGKLHEKYLSIKRG